MKKIYTFGDGFAAGHIWPEWPQILAALCPNYQVINNAGIGAGAEYLVHKLVENIQYMQDSIVIFQWPKEERFDKLVEDSYWKNLGENDQVYHFNFYTSANETWWLSSESKNQDVVDYHNKFVQKQQHKIRSNDYKVLVRHTLENVNCSYLFTSLAEQQWFSQQSKYKSIRQNEIQPSPPVHFDWLMEQALPNLPIVFDSARAEQLKTLIYNQIWEPYYWDRNKVWADLLMHLM